ncbi:MAG: hypothetical protein CYG60_03795, partial [Actinobacteria bacterium]
GANPPPEAAGGHQAEGRHAFRCGQRQAQGDEATQGVATTAARSTPVASRNEATKRAKKPGE